MEYVQRTLATVLQHHLKRGKSILLLGPRQTGKTTLLSQVTADKTITFLEPKIRQRYEKDPSLFIGESRALKERLQKNQQSS